MKGICVESLISILGKKTEQN